MKTVFNGSRGEKQQMTDMGLVLGGDYVLHSVEDEWLRHSVVLYNV